jgi:hypothetical protein
VGEDDRWKLSKEVLHRSLDCVRNIMECGNLGVPFRASLLGLWPMEGGFIGILEDGLFSIHKGIREEEIDPMDPGQPFEFRPIGLNVLEAYATCVLAADVRIAHGQAILLSCQLDRGETLPQSLSAASDLWISLSAFVGGEPCIAMGRGNVDLVQSLQATVETKDLRVGWWNKPEQPGSMFLTNVVGCVIRMIYPGKMLASRVPYLLRNSISEWPRATLRFPVTSELRLRAQRVVDFLLNDPPPREGRSS